MLTKNMPSGPGVVHVSPNMVDARDFDIIFFITFIDLFSDIYRNYTFTIVSSVHLFFTFVYMDVNFGDRRLTTRHIDKTVSFSHERLENFPWNELAMMKVSACLVPRLLTQDPEPLQVILFREDLHRFEARPSCSCCAICNYE